MLISGFGMCDPFMIFIRVDDKFIDFSMKFNSDILKESSIFTSLSETSERG